MEVLLLELDAPLMSFGGVMVDNRGDTQDFPALSMLTGLLANALGYHHGDRQRLERLQERVRYAVREDRRGRRLRDYQTLDLGQDFLLQGWTTRGAPEGRKGGPAKTGTHIRQRWYLADALYLVAVTLEPASETPTLEDLEGALHQPRRPLWLGRKGCLPSRPFLHPERSRLEVDSLLDALRRTPLIRPWRDLAGRSDDGPANDDRSRPSAENEFLDSADDLHRTEAGKLAVRRAWWPADGEERPPDVTPLELRDRRDWRNQIHVGRRLMWQGKVEIEHPEPAGGSTP